MKLAEALNLRADLQKRIAQLKLRLLANAKVQEGDTPAEDPTLLLQELDGYTAQLEMLIRQINKTNNSTVVDGASLVDMIARKDVLTLKISILRDFVQAAANKADR
ncbi:MAG: DIP1984 family protein [Caldilineaceae bacterium]|nr:DIP1984 family protein [Caldilineaceae bacterium]